MGRTKVLAIFVLLLLIIAGFYGKSQFEPVGGEKKTVYFTIESGESAQEIATKLQEQKLIKSQLAFEIYAKLSGADKKFLPGEHQLENSLDVVGVVKNLINPEDITNEKKITIIEGWRTSEVVDYLVAQGLGEKAELDAVTKTENWKKDYEFLAKVPAKTVEGFIFPDTYRVFLDAEPQEIIKKTLDNFDSKLTEKMRSDIKDQARDIFSVITLASIIEREGLSDGDKKMIADVFLKRLEEGMGLQSDATVNYITGKKDLRPSLDDLAIDSPYNTYKYRGLPPGPICNPGLASIKAAIYPQHNDYFYFLTDKKGKAIFAKTYEEHQRNIKKYLE